MTLQLDLLRHGETVAPGRFHGRNDVALSQAGWDQAWRGIDGAGPWSRICSSPLSRCAAFAEALAEERKLPLALLDDLREMDFGRWDGLTAAEVMEHDPDGLGAFWTDPAGYTPPGAEPLAVFQARVLGALESLVDRHPGESVLLVTHGGVIRLLLALARGIPASGLLQIEVALGSLHGVKAGFNDATLWIEAR